jgi:hypothetical protein
MTTPRWPEVPRDLRADWDGTNHYELTSDSSQGEYWFLVLPGAQLDSATPEGRRVGLMLEMAADAPRLADALDAEAEAARLRTRVAELEGPKAESLGPKIRVADQEKGGGP